MKLHVESMSDGPIVLSNPLPSKSGLAWRSVGDELPDFDGKPLLLALSNGAVWVGACTSVGFIGAGMPGTLPLGHVTHWCVMPDGPETR